MATYIPITDIPEQFFDSAGDPLVSGSLEFYLAGTTTATDGFSDNTGTSIGDTITLNSLGYPESGGNVIGLFRDQSKALKIVLKDAVGATVWTMDDIPAVASFDSTSSAKLDFITVTQAVDLDTMETDIGTAYQVDGTVPLTADIVMPAGKFVNNSTVSGIVASTTQTQAQSPLTAQINEVATVANANDVVTLPAAVAGRAVTIINNGANILQIFPAADDSIDDGAADASTTLAAGSTQIFQAIGAIVWESVITATGTAASSDTAKYGAFYDEGNTAAYVINAQTDSHAYHTASIVTGASDGWTFDAGGAGTSVAIASVADGADSGVDIEVTTTGNHGLTAGDIISQTNLADAAYTGMFVVKAIISNTQYEVEAVYTATDTGTMDAAATLTCDVGSDGDYFLGWSASASAATSSDVFDFSICKNATPLPGSSTRRKFGTGGDIGSMSGVSPAFSAVAGDKMSFILSNTSGTGNMTNRNITVRLEELVAVGASASTFSDNVFRVRDNSDITKKIAFEASGITTGTVRTITMPDRDITLGDSIVLGVAQDSVTDTAACSVANYFSTLTTTGAAVPTLADGVEGQLKKIQMIVDAGDAVLTPANLTGGTTITFADVGDVAELKFTAGSWVVLALYNIVDGATAPVLA
jgi:ABC-type amino acid transport system permease subunit